MADNPKYEVRSDIPIPPPRASKFPGLSRQLSELAAGHSIWVPGGEHRYIGGLIAGKVGKKFSQRRMRENGVDGIRIFRLW